MPHGRGTYNRASADRSMLAGERRTLNTSETAAECRARVIDRVLVVGAGTMGSGIAQVIAQASIRTTLTDADTASLERGLEAIASRWERQAATGRCSAEDAAGFHANLSPGTIADAARAISSSRRLLRISSQSLRSSRNWRRSPRRRRFSPRTPRRSRSRPSAVLRDDPTASSDSIFSTRCPCFRW